MPIYTVPKRSHPSSTLGGSLQQHRQENATARNRFGQQFISSASEKERSKPPSQTFNKAKEINKTYVLSACSNLMSPAITAEGRPTLQRTVTGKGQSDTSAKQSTEDTPKEKRLTLQRRQRTGSVEKHKTSIYDTRTESPVPGSQKSNTSVLLRNVRDDTPVVKTDFWSVKHLREVKVGPEGTSDLLFNRDGLESNNSLTPFKHKTVVNNFQNKNEIPRSPLLIGSRSASESPSVLKLAEKRSLSKENSTESRQRHMIRNEGLEKQKTPRNGSAEGTKLTPKFGTTQNVKNPTISLLKKKACPQTVSQKRTSPACGFTPISKHDKVQINTTYTEQAASAKDGIVSHNNCTEDDTFKIENSKVTVAVRVRPFSIRDKNEEESQVISMTGQETVVNHPNTKQIYRFAFDFSFWSFDQGHNFASQEMVYHSLAEPLLEKAFDGYNTCLFAYGQTGSGKSYTMMGFDEDERGIIPRFCEDLFSHIAERETPQIAFQLEMSYFEVYNEKIHDLLVFEAENGQNKQALRVREHPVFGPYVEDLTVNPVSSYSDIQKWLQLGNKHRATAATGMNDKSSRSHSVFTLVMTQTKAETAEKEDHEHRIISRVNLVDLAGSERCSASQTTGERLKEGASINKSLFTLGKVISALAEQNQNSKKMFIPYRESVLTWLLKESLGGNSKTAMIATISPASRNIEETLSTLRYAKQACFIVNIAKVNEDINAKLIRELKAEIEKLKSAHKKIQNGDPEKQRVYVQEITSLRVKLHQQEREMAEMQRAWKEKLEQAEKRKFEETKELQKAGITFKVDNSLPNLVNLNEDPQLSEMLLYMIKEGQTTVGKSKPDSCHDIQLSGVLIADDHCVIKHSDGAVSITPQGEAKTYVNGRCISGPTFLHHGDRIILGGDHYFRFNHPVEVEKIKSRSCGASLPEDGLKDFEFAKNEWLAAQRAQLELEIEEARLKAKEEMMQGIQIAKEMAQEELSTQQKIYENQIKSLEAQLEEEYHRKQTQERNNQVAVNKIQELEEAKRGLELEVHFNRKRLEIETLAAREVLEDHTIRHAKILEALEAEKQKIAQEVEALQQSVERRNKVEPNWNTLKLSMMIKEANTISSKLEKHMVFCRHDVMDKGKSNGSSIQVQVRNIRLGVETFWNLEKFEDKLAAMKEAYEMKDTSKADAVFYDPSDEWEPDLSNVSVSSVSARRSLRKSKRISGCLSELKINLHNSYLSDSSDKLSNLCSDPPGLFLPKLCKELIGSSLDVLVRTHEGDDESNMAQSLLETLFTIYSEVFSLAKAYEQAEESQDNFFIVDQAAQSCTIIMTSAFKQLVILTKHWLIRFPKSDESVKIHDELREDIKHLGGFLQLLFQGGCSDLSSIVAEAEKKIMEMLKRLVKNITYLAVLNGLCLRIGDDNTTNANNIKKQFMSDIYSGTDMGLEHLLECIRKKSRVMQKELLKWYPQDEIQEQLKNKAVDLAKLLENVIMDCRQNGVTNLLWREDSVDQNLRNVNNKSIEFLELHHCLDQTYQAVTSSLEGSYRTRSPFRYFIEKICLLARHLDSPSNPSVSSIDKTDISLCKIPASPVNQSELDTVARSLIISFELGQNSLIPQNDCKGNAQSERRHRDSAEKTHIREPKGTPRWKCNPWPPCERLGESSPSEILWV